MPAMIGRIPISDLEAGVKCPHCTQLAKIYRRKITKPMALGLIELYRFGSHGEFHHVYTKSASKNFYGDFAKLALWDLIEQQPHTPGDKKTSGSWAITKKGVAFVLDRLRVPEYARLYDSDLLALEGTQVNIRDALGAKFNYAALMATTPPALPITRTPVRTPVAS